MAADGERKVTITFHPIVPAANYVPGLAMHQMHQAQLIRDHQRGEHPYGAMRRDCPLCCR